MTLMSHNRKDHQSNVGVEEVLLLPASVSHLPDTSLWR